MIFPPQRQSAASSREVLSSSHSSIGNKTPWDSIKEERHVKKSRKTIDRLLRKVGPVGGKALSLNLENGTCSFPYQRFIVVIELPNDDPDTVYMYTCVCRIEEDSGDNVNQVMRTAMELNYLQDRTRGSSLGFNKENEINLCRSFPLAVLNATKLRNLIDEFLVTAKETNTKLERAKRVIFMATTDSIDSVGQGSGSSGRLGLPERISRSNRARTFTK